MKSITFPKSLKELYESTFKYCSGVKEIRFLGDAPIISSSSDKIFSLCTATVYYPKDNVTWTEDIREHFGEKLTWVPYDPTGNDEDTGDDDSETQDPAMVTRLAGSSRYQTAIAAADTLKDILGIDKFNSIIIASGTNFADALAGSYLAAVKSAPILLHTKKSDSDNLKYVTENLASSGTVYILGGTSAVGESIETLLKNAGISVNRLEGKDRYLTNLKILNEADITGNEILVATAQNFADSLSASATGKPILLVNSKKNILTAEQKAWLAELKATRDLKLTIIGGTGAVSETLEEALSAYGSVSRIYGSTRMLTSVKVAETYFTSPKAAFLAYSGNFPDGLCGGPVAYALGAPLLLVNSGKEAAPAAYVAANGIQVGYILGGDAAVSDASIQAVFGSIS